MVPKIGSNYIALDINLLKDNFFLDLSPLSIASRHSWHFERAL
jgi:hypothetical protein